jgi:hypothetical protein
VHIFPLVPFVCNGFGVLGAVRKRPMSTESR